jgi:lipopolysaccharide biosynthesis protein
LEFNDFPSEPIPDDGTLAHAIERCINYIALSQGFHSLVVAPSIFNPVP